jgi:hypothetical protein
MIPNVERKYLSDIPLNGSAHVRVKPFRTILFQALFKMQHTLANRSAVVVVF